MARLSDERFAMLDRAIMHKFTEHNLSREMPLGMTNFYWLLQEYLEDFNNEVAVAAYVAYMDSAEQMAAIVAVEATLAQLQGV